MNDEGLIVCKSVFKSFYALSFFFLDGGLAVFTWRFFCFVGADVFLVRFL